MKDFESFTLLYSVNNLLSGYKSNSDEARILRNYNEELQELSKMWDEMLTKSVETNKALESKGITGEKFAESVKNDSRTETDNKSGEGVQYNDRGNSESDSIKEQLAKHQEELDNMQVIASIDIRKTFKNAKDAYDWAVEALKQSGYKVDRMGFGEIVFDEKRLKNGLQYLKTNPERVAYSLIPKVLKKGAVIGGHPNHKGRGYSTVTFAAPVEIDGVRGNMAIVVRMEGKNYYKLHRVLMPNGGLFEYKKESSAETAAATRGVVDTPTDTTSNKRIPQPSEKVKKKVTDVQNSDRDYLSAIESGNMDAVQKMVDEKAKVSGAKLLPNGNVQHFYHGTRASFTSFSTEKAKSGNYGYGFYFSPEKSKATGYGDNIKDVYIMTDNFATEQSHKISLEQVTEFAKLYGIEEQILFRADSIEEWMSFKNDLSILNDLQFFVNVSSTKVNKEQLLRDLRSAFDYDGLQHANETILWSNTLVKLADPITYDDNGDIIPLSQRFNSESDDIRYSDRDSEGRTLSEGQMEYFKDSVVRDKDGNLLVMYRGDTEEFTVFERNRSKPSNLYGRGFYFTNSKTHAGQYGKAREFYLDIKNPLSPEQNAITKKQMLKFLKAIENDGENYDLYNYGEGATAESVLSSVWGKGDFEMLQDVSASAVGDLVAAVELFNEVNGTNYDGIIVPTETVTFKSEQAKLTSNKTPTNNDDVQYAERDFSYNELVSKGNIQGVIINNSQQVKLTSDGSIDVKWVIDEVRKKCQTKQTKSSSPTYYIEVLDIDKKVVIDRESIEHNLRGSKAKAGNVSPKALLNARALLEIPEILKHSIEVNRSVRNGNLDVPYSHIMLGTVAFEDANGDLEYYAVRSVVEERVNQNPILTEAKILGRLYAINTKKVDTQRSGVANNSVARLQGNAYTYNIADLLNNVKTEFDDTFSNDVYANLRMQRTDNDFSKNLQYQDRYISSIYDLMGENEKLKRTNKLLEADVERLKELVKLERKLTHGKVFKGA